MMRSEFGKSDLLGSNLHSFRRCYIAPARASYLHLALAYTLIQSIVPALMLLAAHHSLPL